MNHADLPPIMMAEDVAKLLKCDETTVEDKARNGELPAVKFGRGWIFPSHALISAVNAIALEQSAARKNGKSKPVAVLMTAISQAKKKAPPNLPPLSA